MPDRQVVVAVDAWKHFDFLCKNYILNGLDNTLYNVYSPIKTAKELWESLDRKYKTKDAGMKKFVVGRFLDYKMVDSKTIISQVQDLQVILHEIHAEGMVLSESFQVAAIIEKLPPNWKDFQNYLKHKRKEIKLEDLIVRLRIMEDNRVSEKKIGNHSMDSKADVIEEGHKTNKKRKYVGQQGAKGGDSKRFKGNCFVCNKLGHHAMDCRNRKAQVNHKRKAAQTNIIEVEKLSENVSNISFFVVVFEVNLVGNTKEWWVDTGATRHICSDKKMFSSYEAIYDGEKLFMGNSSTSKVQGKGKVILKMTSEKELTLNYVLHVPEIRKNLLSGSLLSKKGFRLLFEFEKFVLTKSGIYVGKGYMSNGLFKMNVMTIVSDLNNKITSSAYMLESSNIWHGRLGHVNFDTLRKLMKLELLPKFKIDANNKWEICVESKLTRASFHNIERSTEPLELIHSDTCDLKYVQTRGGKKYLVTFIDYCTRYCYVYLLRSKDEALEKFMHYKNEVENQLGRKIKAIRSDRGGEYDAPFDRFCQEHGIIHQTSAPYTPQQNGIVERKNRTLKEMMNVMLISSGLPQNLWGEALLSSNYILNKLPHKKLDKTPYSLWKGWRPSYKYLKVWGCLAKVMVPIPKKIKIGPKTIDCIFIGYAINSSAYRFLVHKSDIPDIHVNTKIESRNASFFENIFPSNACDGSSLKRTHDTTTIDIDH